MKELEKNIRKNGFEYTQIRKSPAAYIYAQHLPDKSEPIAFEVFQRKEGKVYTIAGNEIPASVQFPSNESFGLWAFTCKTMESALVKFAELEARYAAHQNKAI